jgi:hypothetical protein
MSGDRREPRGWRVQLYAAAVRRVPSLRYAILRRRFLADSGWVASMHAHAPVDSEGRPIAWYTYSALHFLEGRAKATMDVCEYGAGHSTLWWARRTRSVRAVESDPEWVARLRPRLPENVDLHYQPVTQDGAYARFAADGSRAYDIVVIDGMDRNSCAPHAIEALKPGGVVIWDNADWTDMFAVGLACLDAKGFRQLDFRGLGPLNGFEWTTSIFYRPGENCLAI